MRAWRGLWGGGGGGGLWSERGEERGDVVREEREQGVDGFE